MPVLLRCFQTGMPLVAAAVPYTANCPDAIGVALISLRFGPVIRIHVRWISQQCVIKSHTIIPIYPAF
jgi:hypothetical protein